MPLGVVCPWGVSALGGGVCSWRGCLLLEGYVSALGGLCVCSWGGVCYWGGVSAVWGVSALGGCLLGGCLLLGGVCSWGVSALEGVCSLGVCSQGGVVMVSQHALRGRHRPPPVNRITHTCKDITLAQLRCGR